MEKDTEEKPIENIETPRNKLLYPTHNFGKLEENMVFESIVYQSGIKETKMDSFKIIKPKQKRNLKKK